MRIEEMTSLINPDPPRPLPANHTVGESGTQNEWIHARIEYLRSIKADDIRLYQQQVNAQGRRVGMSVPTIQYTHRGTRYYEVVDTTTSNRGSEHSDRILADDPAGRVYLWEVD